MREKILQFMKEEAYKPLTLEELVSTLGLKGEEIVIFQNVLEDMEREGEIIKTRANRYGVPERMNLVVGILQGNPKGYAFLTPINPDLDDVYVSSTDLNGAMHNDKVVVRLHKGGFIGKQEGEVIRILNRANTTVVGTFVKSRNFGFVIPEDKRIAQDIFVSKSDFAGAENNDVVVVEITRWPEPRRNPEGRVIQRLGNKNAPGIDILAIMAKHKLPMEFPKSVLEELKDVPEIVREQDLKNRKDFRNLPIVTIDGEDAKDLDDAVYVKKQNNGNFYLSVHIADVSYYVQPNTEIDKEAYSRGTSVYLVDRVIPMLPEKLSNGICSLNPKIDRLTLSLEMEIDPTGKVVEYDITQGVIKTVERMTYTAVNKILVDNDHETSQRYKDLIPMFREMHELMEILNNRRMKRGAIDFDFPESKVELDSEGKPVRIVPRERSVAEKIIEEFMLVANETVAEHIARMELPFIYRIHEKPALEKITTLNEFIYNFGYHIKGSADNLHPKAIQELLKKVKGKKEEKIINTVVLRSMKQAKYSGENLGHFGLAAQYYTHFTSPIRRYPDLIVHRILRWLLTGQLTEKRIKNLNKNMAIYALHTSVQERKAEEAERETLDLKKVEYMERHLGEAFEGIISSVTNFGMFVELENTVEGLVHISTLIDDYYHFNEKTYSLVGERTRKTYKLGDKVKIRVARVNKEEKNIDFILISP
ncbi:ribonuclease R [Anaerobranca gottschalkii]|uniref:Ribonuclease R n=1 Tax=Anaerobranca gottschalkii DSM 13577 TaxID=1120990 RepID=A0A1I0AIS6_9FIRM|nr:ribonuclease R [Anaerobranca gottschalkii]SES94077.1 RNAse R [Anaerobranca gottschalkii DSM 13577]